MSRREPPSARLTRSYDPPPRSRPAELGERCICGRQAQVVFLTDKFGEIPVCSAEGGARLARVRMS